jgi:hypothetical protein
MRRASCEKKITDVCMGAAGSLESEDDVAQARDWIRLFAVDSKVVVVPEDVWLRGCGTGWTGGGVEVLGLRDNAAHWAARFWCKGHLRNVLEAVVRRRRSVVVSSLLSSSSSESYPVTCQHPR